MHLHLKAAISANVQSLAVLLSILLHAYRSFVQIF